MLKLFLVGVSILFLFHTASAESVCTDLPSEAVNKELRNNPDGTFTLVEPGFLYDGITYRVYNTDESAMGYCKLLEKTYVRHHGTKFPNGLFGDARYTITLSTNGEITDTSDSKTDHGIKWVKCK